MTYFEFEFNDGRPSDFGRWVKVKSHDIGFPAKNKVTAGIPFSNHIFDFSELYGSQIYGQRKVTYVINVLDAQNYDPESMHALKTQIVNWLMQPFGLSELHDDKIPEYHFMAEVQTNPALADNIDSGELTIEFECYPFMIHDLPEGNDDWDPFDFDEGIAQDVSFDVDGSKTVLLSNPSAGAVDANVTISGGELTITVGGVDYTVSDSGTISLPAGDVYVTLVGTATVSFEFYREVL